MCCGLVVFVVVGEVWVVVSKRWFGDLKEVEAVFLNEGAADAWMEYEDSRQMLVHDEAERKVFRKGLVEVLG